jgi:hypothetical protein
MSYESATALALSRRESRRAVRPRTPPRVGADGEVLHAVGIAGQKSGSSIALFIAVNCP